MIDDIGDIVMFSLLGLVAFAVIVSLYRAHRLNGDSHYRNFNLIDLIATREGKVDRPAFLEMATFMLIAWGFIVLVTKQQWGLLVAYGGMMVGAFSLRAAHSAWLKSSQPKEPPTTTLRS